MLLNLVGQVFMCLLPAHGTGAGQGVCPVCAFVEHDSDFLLSHFTSCDIATKCQAHAWCGAYAVSQLLHAQEHHVAGAVYFSLLSHVHAIWGFDLGLWFVF